MIWTTEQYKVAFIIGAWPVYTRKKCERKTEPNYMFRKISHDLVGSQFPNLHIKM